MSQLSQKLFVFMAENAPIAVVIRKEKKGKCECYQVIKWDMTTNEFTEGQWLMNKQLFINGCAISPDGQLFGWVYNKFWTDEDYAGVSRLPNFTADLFGTAFGRYFCVKFDEDSNPLAGEFKFEQRTESHITLSNKKARPNGLQPQTFTTKSGAVIVLDQYKIISDGVEIYDASENKFVAVKPYM